ncbi:hypothetical protein LOD99_6556 [Oopsacas minuta]|uniref:Uncharacterized protein n=1 Tax=Oopsacas minuta TaxID=111878 RepID=A0AAV7JLU3_9METZ|nr:hypothetical protein LOD99_6556 [Oopsacas minuta]
MAKFIQKAKSRFHFATQGGSGTVLGASSDPKSPQPQLPSPVTTQPAARPESSSSKTAGEAALARYENKTTGQKPRPVTTSSGPVARKEIGMLREARREIEREKPPQDNTDKVAVKIAKKLTIDQSNEPVRSTVGTARVLVDCPLTG